jgi:hypothetical protein
LASGVLAVGGREPCAAATRTVTQDAYVAGRRQKDSHEDDGHHTDRCGRKGGYI